MDHSNLKVFATALAIVAGFGVAGTAEAQGRGDRMGPMDFATLDVDGSGEIEPADLDALRASRFQEFDTNGDGAVSEEEFVAHAAARAGERAGEMFRRLDADGDGMLSRDVLESRGGRGPGTMLIERADTDGSGGVSEEVFEAMKSRFAERMQDGKRRGWGRQHN